MSAMVAEGTGKNKHARQGRGGHKNATTNRKGMNTFEGFGRMHMLYFETSEASTPVLEAVDGTHELGKRIMLHDL